MPDLHFDPQTEVPDLSGKVILITGGTAGLGASAARTLAAHSPAHIYLGGRNEAAAAKLTAALSAAFPATAFHFLRCDLADLSSVQAAARHFLSASSGAPRLQGELVTARLDVLLCNAGIMAQPPALTADGYEVQFGTNHVGHALLIQLLLPAMRATAAATTAAGGSGARCVLLTSEGYMGHPRGGIGFDGLRTPQAAPLWDGLGLAGWIRYGQSKLANLLYAAELARRFPAADTGLSFAAVHPGVIITDLVHSTSWINRALIQLTTWRIQISVEQGGWNSAWACTAELETGEPRQLAKVPGKPQKLVSGHVYFPVGEPHSPGRSGSDAELAARLYDWTERELEKWMF